MVSSSVARRSRSRVRALRASAIAAVAVVMCLAGSAQAQDRSDDDPTERYKVRPMTADDLPRPVMWKTPAERLAMFTQSIVRLRAVPKIRRGYTPISDPGFYGAATYVQIPGQEDEQGVFLTAASLVQGVDKLQLFIDGAWRTSEVVYVDLDLGFAALTTTLPPTHTLVALEVQGRVPNHGRLTGLTFDVNGQPQPIKPVLGKLGEDGLAFYRAVTPNAQTGTPLLTPQQRVVGIVALNLEDSWTISDKPLGDFMARLADPSKRTRTPTTTSKTFELERRRRNPFESPTAPLVSP